MKESIFQSKLVDKLKNLFPECIVMKTDASSKQGLPDLLILYNDKWAALECKKSEEADHQPNQDYYVDLLNNASFARFIYPENEEEVLHELEETFRA